MTTIAYKGTAPAMTDLMGGQVDIMCDQTTNTTQQIEGGKVKAFAVTTPKRITMPPVYKDLPTLQEVGMKGFDVSIWHGLYAPKGTPAAVVEAMQAEMKKALNSDELKGVWNGLGADTPNLYGADFGKFVGSEVKRWAEVVKASGAKLD